MTRALRLSALILLLASPTMPGGIQTAAHAQAQAQSGLVPLAPQPAVQPPSWRLETAQELLLYIQNIGQEGLDSADYGPDRLSAAIAGGDEAALTQVATPIF